jgi:hypothetical protein
MREERLAVMPVPRPFTYNSNCRTRNRPDGWSQANVLPSFDDSRPHHGGVDTRSYLPVAVSMTNVTW